MHPAPPRGEGLAVGENGARAETVKNGAHACPQPMPKAMPAPPDMRKGQSSRRLEASSPAFSDRYFSRRAAERDTTW